MQNSLWYDIKYGFMAKHGAIGQIIVINALSFVTIVLVGVMFWLLNVNTVFDSVVKTMLGLSSNWREVLTHPWTLFTYMFVHDWKGIFHILFNMLWLFWIGQLLRQYMGDRSVWVTYILGGLSGGLLYLISYSLLPRLQGTEVYLVGASAGVNAVILATATFLPNYAIYLMLLGPVKLKWIALFFVIFDIISLQGHNTGGMIAHLGGALFGFLYIYYYQRDIDLGAPFVKLYAQVVSFFDKTINKKQSAPAPKVRISYRNPNSNSAQPQSQAQTPHTHKRPSQHEIDRILDKIKAVGYERLTQEEKQTLFNASQQD